MRSSYPLIPHVKPGFTLVELLVTISIIVVLAVLAVAGGSAVLTSSRQAKCMGNLRNIGTALHLYAADRGGALPGTTHTAGLDGSWIYALEEYLGEFDETRICPADPLRDQRLRARGTSYLLNSFIFVPETDPFGMPVGSAMNHLNRIPEPSRTLVASCARTPPASGRATTIPTRTNGGRGAPCTATSLPTAFPTCRHTTIRAADPIISTSMDASNPFPPPN